MLSSLSKLLLPEARVKFPTPIPLSTGKALLQPASLLQNSVSLVNMQIGFVHIITFPSVSHIQTHHIIIELCSHTFIIAT